MIGPLEAGRKRQLVKKGRTLTLIRDNSTSVALLGYFGMWAAEQMTGTVLRQGDVRIDVLASDMGEYPIPPRDPDLITVEDQSAYTVIFANPVYEAQSLIGWTIAARGE